jgi:hypothetical protein
MLVIHNTQKPESSLEKKLNSIFDHYIQESNVMSEALTAHIHFEGNPADILYQDHSRSREEESYTVVVLDILHLHFTGGMEEDRESSKEIV